MTDPAAVSAAFSLARGISMYGAKARADLIPPRAIAAVIDGPLAYEVERGWLRIDGDQASKGTVNPVPMEEIGDPSSPQWGPGMGRYIDRR